MKSILAIFILLGCGAQAQQPANPVPVTGEVFEGEYLDLDGSRHVFPVDKPIVVDLSASWCGACNDEAESWSRYLSGAESKVLIVTMLVGEELEDASSFKAKHGSTWSFGIDEGRKIYKKYCKENLVPCNLVIINGKVQLKKIGELPISVAESLTGKWK